MAVAGVSSHLGTSPALTKYFVPFVCGSIHMSFNSLELVVSIQLVTPDTQGSLKNAHEQSNETEFDVFFFTNTSNDRTY